MGDEVIKAVLAALATAVVAQFSSVFEVLTDPNSPTKLLDDGQKTIGLIGSWATASEQLRQMSPSPLRDVLQETINQTVVSLNDRMARFAEMREARRTQFFRFLGFLRLVGQEGTIKRISAFIFYVSVILLVQSIRLWFSSRWNINPWTILIFAGVVTTSWLLSWPKEKATMRKPV
jgi:hypothetical protein